MYFAESNISTTTENTDGDDSSTTLKIATTTEPYLLTTIPSDDGKVNK